ncbi:ABC transporter permease [Bacillus sp. CECT 9360]|uniref:ABC transporter permease n=1 Tax=Bacillus sp. CECT 9360 TaxID=2845821 RepID=UPI001E3A7771|nr:ABC transporter permease [Bacillus sp. CECT 9360]CAH0343901.1 Inner membrane ABC transporter permease protein YtfT [Bacillus sp. CECT 9360]
MKQAMDSFLRAKIFWPLAALVLLLLINAIMIPGFFTIEVKDGHLFGSTIDILNRVTPLLVIAIGMTLVIAKEGIDISVGSVLAIAAAASADLLNNNASVSTAIIAALLIGVVCGLWNGVLVAYFEIQPMIATLILMTVGRGIAQLITDGQILTVHNEAFQYIGKGFLLGLPFSIFIGLTVLFIILFLKKKTALGLFLESIGANMTGSIYTGIQPKRIILIVYMISGVCAAIAGLIVCANVSSADANNAGLWIELDAILAVVIGGTSMRGGRYYLGGTLVGALFIQTLSTTIYSMGIRPEITMVVKAIVVIIVCLLQSPEFRQMFKQPTMKKKVNAA